MHKVISILLAGSMAIATPGCGLIFGYGGLQPVEVKTNPEGAALYLDGGKTEETGPGTLMMHPGGKHSVSAKTEDGKTGARQIGKTIRIPVVILDICLTAGIGLLIDYLSGSLYQLDTPVVLNLGKAPERPDPVTTSGTGTSGTGTTNVLDPSADPCGICGEPRGDASPCPHCGMD